MKKQEIKAISNIKKIRYQPKAGSGFFFRKYDSSFPDGSHYPAHRFHK
ncbi:Uncharacterized protein dnm_096800 [Desulfonema magnum]|uniref:Uncharacterized protein n=1 Tax=Desulfonema magnum TaxID=45655 RepID=A0A975BYB9_9BACT|nr:Uncharacterized protein dnm_096800 [Desulfonema magnum]